VLTGLDGLESTANVYEEADDADELMMQHTWKTPSESADEKKLKNTFHEPQTH